LLLLFGTVTSMATLSGGGVTAGAALAASLADVDAAIWSESAASCALSGLSADSTLTVSQFGFWCSFVAEAEKAGRC